ncbi:hypothetical protein BHM03_00022519 [Ensete ventricosum]|nr:hypothetical protein BHM03_00022519 [Ensete ventricosum]
MLSTARIGVVDRVCSEENGLVWFRPISQPGRRSGDLSVSLPSPAGGANYLGKKLKRYKIIQIANRRKGVDQVEGIEGSKKMGDVPLDEDVAVGIGEENGQYHLADRIGWKKKTAPASFLPAAVGSIVRCPFSESRSGLCSEARIKTVGPWALERTSPHTPPLFGLVVH